MIELRLFFERTPVRVRDAVQLHTKIPHEVIGDVARFCRASQLQEPPEITVVVLHGLQRTVFLYLKMFEELLFELFERPDHGLILPRRVAQ